MTGGIRASVVIPAHDEEHEIVRCLAALADLPWAAELEVVVSANGCTDATAAAARKFRERLPGLEVIELDAASKRAALNAGDQVTHGFPRIYLDADIVLDREAMNGLVSALTTTAALVSSPHVQFDSAGASWVVRRFYDAYAQLPYVCDGLIGLGVYGMSESGRKRFDDFPDVVADDLFVQRCFAESERVTCSGTFTVRTPRTTRFLFRVRTRIAQGNRQLSQSELNVVADVSTTTSSTLRSLARQAARDPSMAASVAVYVLVTIAARIRARRSVSTTWLRDESSRGQPR